MIKHFIVSAILFSLSHMSTAYAEGTVLSLNNPTNPPLTTKQHTGFLDIIAGEAFKRCGLTLELIKLPAERALQNANDGIDDGDLSRIEGLEKHYPNLIRVPVKLFDMDFVAFTNNPAIHLDNIQQLAQFNIGLIRGWKILENITEGFTHVTPVRNAENLFAMLQKQRIDIALYSRVMGNHLVKKLGIDNIRVLEPPLASKEMFIFLHKKHSALIPLIAQSLKQIKLEGMYKQVFNNKIHPM